MRPSNCGSWAKCFAYAAASDGYACLDFALGADSTGPDEVEPMDFTAWKPVPHTAWSGHKAFQLVGAAAETVAIAEKPYDIDSPVVEKMSEAEALALVAEKGYSTDLDMVEKELEPGTWVDIGGASLRFRSRLHTGDASEYYIGSLQFVCAGEILSSAEELLTEGRGERAVAFVAPDARSVVVSVVQSGGGEGSWYVRILNLRIDVAERCSR